MTRRVKHRTKSLIWEQLIKKKKVYMKTNEKKYLKTSQSRQTTQPNNWIREKTTAETINTINKQTLNTTNQTPTGPPYAKDRQTDRRRSQWQDLFINMLMETPFEPGLKRPAGMYPNKQETSYKHVLVTINILQIASRPSISIKTNPFP